ncbi:hypothetical protein LCGC14_1549730 [marine sediment metagenome]|uniref:Uncharacterized protein n=1 Tax=marine sediment metagenome TaxID=412755 RepID=A0A0F9LRF8_9ZZZZ
MTVKGKPQLVTMGGFALGSFGVGAYISELLPLFISYVIINIGVILSVFGILLSMGEIGED